MWCFCSVFVNNRPWSFAARNCFIFLWTRFRALGGISAKVRVYPQQLFIFGVGSKVTYLHKCRWNRFENAVLGLGVTQWKASGILVRETVYCIKAKVMPMVDWQTMDVNFYNVCRCTWDVRGTFPVTTQVAVCSASVTSLPDFWLVNVFRLPCKIVVCMGLDLPLGSKVPGRTWTSWREFWLTGRKVSELDCG